MESPQIHHRRSIRLKGYDYSLEGAYFVTMVSKGRVCLFGEIVDGEMHLSKYGKIVLSALEMLPSHYPNIELNDYVVMPNHIHMIIVITVSGRGGSQKLPKPHGLNRDLGSNIISETNETRPYTLSEIVRGFKSFSARSINLVRQSTGSSVWQRNYYERIIRNERELEAIHDYIVENPRNWAKDDENSGAEEINIGAR